MIRIIFKKLSRYLFPLCFLPISVSAQNSNNKILVDESIVFNKISIEEGLSQSSVYDFCQDDLGFMWVGTLDGLNKYDGYEFSVLRKNPNDVNSLSHNSIRHILKGRDGLLWIGTHDGLTRFDRNSFKYKIYRWEQSAKHTVRANFVNCLQEDDLGRIWIGTEMGLSYYDPETESVKVYSTSQLPLKTKLKTQINAIYIDKFNIIWVATSGGIFSVNSKEQHQKQLADDLSRSVGDVPVEQIVEDNYDNYWVATQKGLLKYHYPSGQSVIIEVTSNPGEGITDADVSCLLYDSNDQLWIGTKNGLNVYSREKNQIFQFLYDPEDILAISNNYILSLYEDKGGVIWVGTFNGGLTQYSPTANRFNIINKRLAKWSDLSQEIIYGIVEDHQNNLWLGTDSYGLNRIDKKTGQVTVFKHDKNDPYSLSNNYIRALITDVDGNIWIGTFKGINKYDPKTNRFTRYHKALPPPYQIQSDTIPAIRELKSGDILFGTFGNGVYRIDKRTGSISDLIQSQEILSNTDFTVQDILEDSNGDLWIATYGEGLIYYSNSTSEINVFKNNPEDRKTLSNNFIFCLHEDNDKNLWVGTAGSGLDRYDRSSNQFIHNSEIDGLPNNFIYGMLEDSRGSLWISTNNGLSNFNPDLANIRERDKAFTNYDIHDGLSSNEFNFGAYYKNEAGILYFGSINGLTWFDPSKITESQYKPNLVFTAFKILNKRIRPGKDSPIKSCINTIAEIEISYLDYAFSFEFSALDYVNPAKNQYAYKMEGVDKDWIYTDANQRLASYTNLDGGTYTFKVKGTNSSGIWNETPAKIDIIIVPAFWQATWFKILIFLLIIALVVTFYFLRLHRIEKHNIELQLSNAQLNREINERKKAEKALIESEEKYRIFVERANDAIVIIQDMKIKYFNPQLEQILDVPKEKILDQPFHQFVHADEVAKLENRYKRRLAGEEVENFYESRLQKMDGNVVPVELNASVISYEGKPADMVFIRTIGEKKKLEEDIRQIQKMEAVGQLAGGVAHDFNNILTIINGNAELLLMQMDEKNKYFKFIEEIKNSGNRAANLTRQLLAFSRRQIIDARPLDINELIKNMEKMLQRLIGEHIEIRFFMEEHLPLIKADPGQLEQTIMNLVINARDAILENKNESVPERITLTTNLFEIASEKFADIQGLVEGTFIQISITDTGAGMTKEVSDKIFEPFFTTKETGKGTGLGLSTVFGIIQQNNGSINVYSEPGVGTTIKIFWPATTDKKESTDRIKEKKEVLTGNESLMLVEDDRGVREFACSSMKGMGYKVHGEANGKKALDYLESNSDHPDLIITDLIMPEMNGKELAARVNKINKNIKIIFTSGYTDDYIVQDGTLEKGVEFLQKPYSVKGLAQKIREVLDKR